MCECRPPRRDSVANLTPIFNVNPNKKLIMKPFACDSDSPLRRPREKGGWGGEKTEEGGERGLGEWKENVPVTVRGAEK